MKILIDIGHPGHVHLFKNFVRILQDKGHEIRFVCREKEFEIALLKAYKFSYKSFGKKYANLWGKLWGLVKFDLLMLREAIRFRPDFFLSHGSPYAAHAAFLVRKPHISMEDTGNMEQLRLYLPFTDCVLTSESFHRDLGNKQIRYKGFHELAYLHPNYFEASDAIYTTLGIPVATPYVILRFISWNASHDRNQFGISKNDKEKIVRDLSKKYKVFISSEGALPEDLASYKIVINPENMHQVLANAALVISEGATIASECAVLGVPVVYVNSIDAGTIDEQIKRGLLYRAKNGKELQHHIANFEQSSITTGLLATRKKILLEETIDLTAFLVWFFENFPTSKTVATQGVIEERQELFHFK